jgi:hypothetical protein
MPANIKIAIADP